MKVVTESPHNLGVAILFLTRDCDFYQDTVSLNPNIPFVNESIVANICYSHILPSLFRSIHLCALELETAVTSNCRWKVLCAQLTMLLLASSECTNTVNATAEIRAVSLPTASFQNANP